MGKLSDDDWEIEQWMANNGLNCCVKVGDTWFGMKSVEFNYSIATIDPALRRG